MGQKSLTITYSIYEGFSALDEASRQLLEAAIAALDHSYAPYSNFKVGAALRLSDGTIIRGANFENASYPLCLCAERSAIAAARSHDHKAIIEAMAITARNVSGQLQFPVTPCGACRQVLSEVEQMQGEPIQLILNGQADVYWVLESVGGLLPLAFDAGFLK